MQLFLDLKPLFCSVAPQTPTTLRYTQDAVFALTDPEGMEIVDHLSVNGRITFRILTHILAHVHFWG